VRDKSSAGVREGITDVLKFGDKTIFICEQVSSYLRRLSSVNRKDSLTIGVHRSQGFPTSKSYFSQCLMTQPRDSHESESWFFSDFTHHDATIFADSGSTQIA